MAINTYKDLILAVWNCLPSPEIEVLVRLSEGFFVPGTAIPEGEVRAPFENITPAWAGEARLASFEALWKIVYSEIEIEGITFEVASSQVLPVIWLNFMLTTGVLKYPGNRDPCETRPFPR